MAEGGASHGFDSPKLDLRGARDKDSLFHRVMLVNQQLEKTTKNSDECKMIF